MPDVEDLTAMTDPAAGDLLHIVDVSAVADPKDRKLTLANLFKNITSALQSLGSGGNARGTAAVDLQVTRTLDTEVSSGNYSVISGGRRNTAGFTYDTVGGGSQNNATGFIVGMATVGGGANNSATGGQAVVCGGKNNTASGGNSVICGGQSNVASVVETTVIGGINNTASAEGASILGGIDNTASALWSAASGRRAVADKHGQFARAADYFAIAGDAQYSSFICRCLVTHSSNAWFTLFLDGTDDLLTIATDAVWTFRAQIVGTTQGCAKSFGFEIKGVIENDGGTVALLATTTTTLYDTDDASFDAQAVADDPNNALLIQVQDTDAAGDVVRWVASIQITEVTFPA